MTLIQRSYKTYIVEGRFTAIIISIAVLAMRIAFFMLKDLPKLTITESDFIWRYIYTYFDNPLVSFISSTICVFIIAIFVSQLNIKYGIIRTRTSLAFSMPLIVFSAHPIFYVMSPVFISIIFILWALFPMFDSHQLSHQPKFAFQSGILLSAASMFSIYSLLLIPIWWHGQNKLSSRFGFRTFLASLWGIILMYWIVFALYVFGDNLPGFASPFIALASIVDVNVLPKLTVPQWGFLSTILIFFIVYLTIDKGKVLRDKVSTQKILSFVNTVIVFSLLFQIIYFTQTLFWFYLAIAFISIILAHYYSVINGKIETYSFFLLLFLVLVIYLVNLFTTSSPF